MPLLPPLALLPPNRRSSHCPRPAEDEALAALRIISAALGKARLRHLNLSDNALGEKGIRACAAAFSEQVGADVAGCACVVCMPNLSWSTLHPKAVAAQCSARQYSDAVHERLVCVLQPALESIAFQNVGCSVHGCAAVDELMRNTGSLRRLHLYNNMSGDEGAASIARWVWRLGGMPYGAVCCVCLGNVSQPPTACSCSLAAPSSLRGCLPACLPQAAVALPRHGGL